MLPDLSIDYPGGMGGLGLDDSFVRRYLSKNLTILLGDADTNPDAPDLPQNEAARVQGPHRLARGLWYYEYCRKVAQRLGTSFGWRVETVPGAVHVDQAMFEIGAQIWSGWKIGKAGRRSSELICCCMVVDACCREILRSEISATVPS